MEFDEFLSQARWQILEIIAKKPTSPVAIAEKIGTSVAYVSQQLKILEAVNLVVKEKTGEFQKGKPRSLYSISKDLVYITSLLQGLPSKKLIYPIGSKDVVLRIWAIEDESIHYSIEKYYWGVENNIDAIEGIYFSGKTVYVISSDKDVRSFTQSYSKNKNLKIDFQVLAKFDSKKIDDSHLHSIYDPRGNLKTVGVTA